MLKTLATLYTATSLLSLNLSTSDCTIESFDKYGWTQSFESEAFCEAEDGNIIMIDLAHHQLGDEVTIVYPSHLDSEDLMYSHDIIKILGNKER
ncbi:hypothetical protein [Alkalihalobacillus trypoxylicola]|uniref:Uncharacterized protein n=1 Tax=Alkalihalobacillus trypoxylicola TaxID=519424 RepID=A0A162D559_9BACI|nr:hypothetical protein [Alkalihalobacillus trypoxylicola]KYG28137.1 hypothetical protein AZF04_09545 [Alkalihalobacillus trypoxylicola]